MKKLLTLIFVSLIFTTPLHADEKFNRWLVEFQNEAVSKGISRDVVQSALKDIKPVKKVVKLDKKQPEKTITLNRYLKNVINQRRINTGAKYYKKYHKLLKKIAKQYGVQPRFILALWGIETDFGRNMGGFYVPQALLTLAYDGRRSKFFRKELIEALKIIDNNHIKQSDMKGSWAGAMGQCQFMPSSFNSYAVDYNNDGKKDIWTNRQDVFASIANYLSQSGWNDTQKWGRDVKLPKNFNKKLLGRKIIKTVNQWNKLGIRNINGKNLPKSNMKASIVMPLSTDNQAFMIYGNYRTIMKWNRSLYFATAVGKLSDAIYQKFKQ